MADKNLVEQTTNHFYTWAKIDQKHIDAELVERIQADCFREDYAAWKSTYYQH